MSLLNAFFQVVVEVVAAHDGWVNKFEGDAALCVFGAPLPDPDAATSALAAARELCSRLERELRHATRENDFGRQRDLWPVREGVKAQIHELMGQTQ